MKNERKQDIWRKYNFSDSELIARCHRLSAICTRDQLDIEKAGYVVSMTSKLGHLAGKFMQLRTDEELAGDWMVVSEKKEAARQELINAIRSVMAGVSRTYDTKSGQYRRFGTRRITDQADHKLLFVGRRVIRVHYGMSAQLEHVKANAVERLNIACNQFERSLNLVEDKNSDRDMATETRVRLGNELYDHMMTITDFGKAAFVASSPAKYNEYLNYESNAEAKAKRKKETQEDRGGEEE